jgi:hypothetical protein
LVQVLNLTALSIRFGFNLIAVRTWLCLLPEHAEAPETKIFFSERKFTVTSDFMPIKEKLIINERKY